MHYADPLLSRARCSDLTPAGWCEVTGRMFSRGLASQHRNSRTYALLDSSPLACVYNNKQQ
ncbi:hypothetical protein E2C01_085717 [Portunus trituberculatus]|uniref:Uncharacterized protein n=1 Tax=Portunus trituberculatus TaxID=210409 RepID=A0A5B7J1R6_PORTR|nr:hypothetical protein [Portunus trituberculatus]